MTPEADPTGIASKPADATFERDRGVTHLSAREGVSKISVQMDCPREELARVFEALAEGEVNVYLIKLNEDCVEFAVDSEQMDQAIHVVEELGFRYALVRSCALMSVVAPAMRDLSGVLWQIIGAMRAIGVEVLELADTYNAVSCLVPEADLARAVEALSETFGVELSTEANPLDPW